MEFDPIAHRPRSIQRLVVVLSVLLCAQIATSYAISIDDQIAGIPGLEQLPDKIDDWRLTNEEPLDPAVSAYLKPDDYVQRAYLNPIQSSPIDLFVAYFKSIQNSYGPHSPNVCLPNSGWLVRSFDVINLAVGGNPQGIPVNKYVMEKAGEQILVLYWYQNARRSWTDQLEAKLHLLPDLVRYHRSDVSLVRIITPIGADTADESFRQATTFAADLFPYLVWRFRSV
jgi:EpsI family protein